MTFDESIKRAILSQMAVAGIGTKADLAERAGMAPNTLGRFLEAGGNIRTLRKIAVALRVTAGHLLTEAEHIRRNDNG